MGKLQEFDITFTNNKVVYSPGESITGTIKIRTANTMQFTIKVNCQGSCGISNKMNDPSWAVEEQYFNSTLSVADKGTLSAGEHSFPSNFHFLCSVSAAVPTSFEGPVREDRVRGYKAGPLTRSPLLERLKAQRSFYLLHLLNLNEVPPIEVVLGTADAKAHSDLRGYIPGQVIVIHRVSAQQKVTYRTKRPVMDLRTIAEVEGAGVKGGKHAEWKEQIIVPPLPQSALAGCSLIDIDYFIQVSLKSPEAVVTLPIYIGNIAVNLTPSQQPDSTPFSAVGVVSPSAPPCEDNLNELCAGGGQDPSGQPVCLPPGAALPHGGLYPDLSAQLFCLSTGATIPFFTEGGDITPIPTSCSLILPPEYSSWDFPQGESSSFRLSQIV
uniref:Arrestin domain containing 1b n=1 Tax=Neogobius melanostomus TaxID=47308 RepID=A0A8C6TG51_9GOBI